MGRVTNSPGVREIEDAVEAFRLLSECLRLEENMKAVPAAVSIMRTGRREK